MNTPSISLPILGNPHGRIFEALQPDEDPSKILRALLNRYGDLVPRKGVVTFHDHQSEKYELTYSQIESGRWVISDPTPIREDV